MSDNTKIYGIREKATGNFCTVNRRCAWLNRAAAKSSYLASTSFRRGDGVKFDDQDEYEIIELTEIVRMYERLCK